MFAGRRWHVVIGVSVVFAFSALGAGENQGDARAPQRDPNALVLQGLTRPSKQVALALRVPGVIAERPIEEGDHVKAGQLIAVLESGPEEAAVRISQLRSEDDSEILAAEVNETKRREELERHRKIAAKGSSSVWELRVVELAFEFAKAQTETSRVRREQRRREWMRDQAVLDLRTLHAPFDGVIWRTTKDVGEVVGVYEQGTIAVLLRLDPLCVELNVPARYLGRITINQEATVTVDEQVRVATVVGVDPIVDSGSSTFRVKLELGNEDGAFTAGIPASVRIELPSPPGRIAKRAVTEATIVQHRSRERTGTMGR